MGNVVVVVGSVVVGSLVVVVTMFIIVPLGNVFVWYVTVGKRFTVVIFVSEKARDPIVVNEDGNVTEDNFVQCIKAPSLIVVNEDENVIDVKFEHDIKVLIPIYSNVDGNVREVKLQLKKTAFLMVFNPSGNIIDDILLS